MGYYVSRAAQQQPATEVAATVQRTLQATRLPEPFQALQGGGEFILVQLPALQVLLDLQLQHALIAHLLHHHRLNAGPSQPPRRLETALAGNQFGPAIDQDRVELSVTAQTVHHRFQVAEVGADSFAHHHGVDANFHTFIYRRQRSVAVRRA